MKPTQQDKSTALENSRLIRDSRGQALYDLVCFNGGAETLYLLAFDSGINVVPGELAITIDSDLDTISGAGADPSWIAGTPVRFTTDDALPAAITAGVTYYLGGALDCSLHRTYADAIAGIGQIKFATEGSGNHTMHVLDWVDLPPVQIPAKGTASLSYGAGAAFDAGILVMLSKLSTGYSAPDASSGRFHAVYSA